MYNYAEGRWDLGRRASPSGQRSCCVEERALGHGAAGQLNLRRSSGSFALLLPTPMLLQQLPLVLLFFLILLLVAAATASAATAAAAAAAVVVSTAA